MLENQSEQKFKEYMDEKECYFYFIDQSQETYAHQFNNDVKRPDCCIMLGLIGTIDVEIKKRSLNSGYQTFTIDEEEIRKLIEWEKIFKRFVWFAISNENFGFKTWFWINLQTVIKKSEKKLNKKDNKEFRAIKIEDCITIGWNDPLNNLLNI